MPVPDSGASFWLCICIHVHGTWAGLGVCLSHGKLTVLSAYRHVPQVAMMGQGQIYFTTAPLYLGHPNVTQLLPLPKHSNRIHLYT